MIALPLRLGEDRARWAVPIVGITFRLLTAYAAFTIDQRTAASPPSPQTLGLTAIYVAGAVLPLSRPRVKVPAAEP